MHQDAQKLTTTGLPRAAARSNWLPSSKVSEKAGAGRAATGTLPTVPAARLPMPQTIRASSATMARATTSATTRAERALTSGAGSATWAGSGVGDGDGATGAVTG